MVVKKIQSHGRCGLDENDFGKKQAVVIILIISILLDQPASLSDSLFEKE
jgi:hypothetical protein